jgi:hypothetical protein
MATVDALAALRDALDEIESEDSFLENVDAELAADLESVESRARVAAYLDTIRTEDAVEDLTVHDVTGSSADLTLTVADGFQPEPTLDVAVTHVADQEELHDFAGDDPDVIVEEDDSDTPSGDTQTDDIEESDEADEAVDPDDVSPSEDHSDDESGFWCGRCGEKTDTENGVKIHNGHNHDGDAIVLEEEPREDDLVQDDADDEEADEEEETNPGTDDEDDKDDNDDDDDEPDGDLMTDDAEGTTEESADDTENADADADTEDVEPSVSWSNAGDDTAEASTTADGDDEDDGRMREYPRDCGSCTFTAEGGLEWAVHRTEDHESPQSTLDYLDPGEFADLVEDADTVGELADAVDWGTSRVLTLLGIYGLADEVASSGGNLEHVTDVEFDGFVDDVNDDPSPLATDDSPHKYDTGDSAVTNPDTDDEDGDEADVDAEDLEPCVLDDFDVERDPGVDDEFIRQAARRVDGFAELRDEIGVPDKAIARVAAIRLDVYAEAQRAPQDSNAGQTEAGV